MNNVQNNNDKNIDILENYYQPKNITPFICPLHYCSLYNYSMPTREENNNRWTFTPVPTSLHFHEPKAVSDYAFRQCCGVGKGNGGACGICCPGGCACIGTTGGGYCECLYNLQPFKKPHGINQADPRMNMDFMSQDIPLTYLAQYFDFLFPDQILIPASKVHKQVTTEKLERIKLVDLIEKIGLVPAKKALVGRDFTKS